MFKPKGTSTDGALSKEERQAQKQAEARVKESAESHIISGLQTRRSLLPQGSAYDKVADSVLAANSRAAEAELRAAMDGLRDARHEAEEMRAYVERVHQGQ
mgnify:CR=1 FL=1